MRLLMLCAASAMMLALLSCSARHPAPPQNSTVRIEGSSTVYPISLAMAREYERKHDSTRIEIHSSSTGAGFQRFVSGSIDIVNASRPIKRQEVQVSKANGIRFIELPIAYDAVAVVVSRDNTWARTISKEELARIWAPDSEGTVVRWDQVKPNWPERPLHLFAPDKASGTFDYFTKAIMGKAGSSRQDYVSSDDDKFLVEAVAKDECALGYFGLSYYEANVDRLRALAIHDKDTSDDVGPQTPSPANVLAQTYKPLSRPLLIYVSEAATARPEVRGFVEYFLSHARRLVGETRSVPLSSRVAEATIHRFRERTYGTQFGGKGATVGVSLDDLLDVPIEELIVLPVQ